MSAAPRPGPFQASDQPCQASDAFNIPVILEVVSSLDDAAHGLAVGVEVVMLDYGEPVVELTTGIAGSPSRRLFLPPGVTALEGGEAVWDRFAAARAEIPIPADRPL